MRRILLLLFFIISYSATSQILPLLESEAVNKKSSKSAQTFKELAQEAEDYFSVRDVHKKGSGYKPFKRWEYHWKYYLKEDGTIAPPKLLWDAWNQKNDMAKSSSTVSNWTDKGPFDQTSKSGQGRINTVLVDPNNDDIIYVGAPAGGLWKSTDAGINWTPLTDHLPQIGVSGIAIHPNDSNTIYISTGDDDASDSYSIGVLKSTDGGLTWSSTGNLLGDPILSNEIVIDPSDANKIWVATSNGLFLSTNAGTSWSQKQSGHIRDFKLKPNEPQTIYAVSSDTFYVSTNGGNSFNAINSGLPNSSSLGRLRVEVTTAAPNNVYILGAKTRSENYAFEGIYKSTNSGISFTKTQEENDIFQSNQAWYDLAFVISPTNSDIMFVGVLDIWKSSNEGDDFTKINDWRIVNETFTHADIHFMRYYGDVLYAGTDGGVYKSTDNGASFIDLTKNLSISQFYKISVSKQNSTKLAGGLQDNGGFSYNNSLWYNYHGGDGMEAASDPNNENIFYGFTQFGGALTVTNTGGISSSFVTSGPFQGNWVTPLVATKSSDLYAGYDQLYRLENSSWSKVSNHRFENNIEVLEIDPNNNNNIFAAIGSTLFTSTDKGKTFVSRSTSRTGLSGSFISSIEIHNSDSNIVWVTMAGSNPQFPSSGHTGGGVFKSEDGGQTFTNISSGLPFESKFIVRHHPYSTNNSIYVGTALGVYHRNDDTDVWEVFSTNLPNVAITDLEINPYDATITASTYGRSVWQSPIPEITLPVNDADLIKISLPQNSVSCGTISSSISVLNNGTNNLTSLVLNYNLDGGVDQTINWRGDIATNAIGLVELPELNVTEGSHILNVRITQINDENLLNNNLSSAFNINQNQSHKITYTFGDLNPANDERNGEWLVSNSLWEIGKPTTTDFNNTAESAYATNPTGNYSDGTIAYLYSPCYNMTNFVNPILKFNMAFDIELNWDVLYMEYSLDGGTSWRVLGTANDPNWYNSSFIDPNRRLTIGKQWTGKDATLKQYEYDLTEFTNEATMMFRFVFASDAAVNEEGVVIDDFIVDADQVLSTDDLDASDFSIYPNPSESVFNIKRSDLLGEEMDINVYDITGKLILSTKGIIQNNYSLDMTAVSKGIYFMRISIDNKSLVKKLILN